MSSDGQLLSARIASDEQWRFPLIDSVPKKFETALLQFEDKTYYSHLGVSLTGLLRAIWLNAKHGKVVSGGSTLTMQVIRLSRQQKSRTVFEKCIEMIWAIRLHFKFSKKEVLAIYATHAPFGGNTVGLETASWRYFNRSPNDLTWAEASLLAVLPNAPGLLHLGKNRDALLHKRNALLKTLLKNQKIDRLTYELSLLENLPLNPKPLPNIAPHLLNRMMANGNSGRRLSSHINRAIQLKLIEQLNIAHERLKNAQIENLAGVIIDIEKRQVVGYVGNAYGENIEGKYVDILSARRSSGSILKPFLYGKAFDEGLIAPHSLISDIPINFLGYDPTNYYPDYDGVVPANKALQRSLNIPAVLLLQQLGVGPFKHLLNKAGLNTIDRSTEHYGLSLALGGAEVNLLELTNAYAHIASRVVTYPYEVKSYRTTLSSDLHFSVNSNLNLSAGSAFTLLDILSEVSRPVGQNHWKQFNSGRKIAWKTGTSIGHRDAWAVGLNKKYAVGIWAGNADGEGRPGLTGLKAAAPLLFRVMNFLPEDEWFEKPFDDLSKVAFCAKSGFLPTDHCPNQVAVYSPRSKKNLRKCPFHQTIFTTREGNQRALKGCYNGDLTSNKFFVLSPVEAAFYNLRHPDYTPLPKWVKSCSDGSSRLQIIYPFQRAKVSLPMLLNGKLGKINLKAFSSVSNDVLQWYLNNAYLGTTRKIHEKSIQLSPGEYVLSVCNTDGSFSKTHFSVIDSNLKMD